MLSTLTKILTGAPFRAAFTPFEESMLSPRPHTSPTVAFATERRHFEQEARRLWHQFRGKKFRRPRIASMPISDDDAGAEALTEPLSIEESSNPSRIPSRSSNQDRKRLGLPVNEDQARQQPRSPRGAGKRIGQFFEEESPASVQKFVSCLTHPRKWREQVLQTKAELIDGDFKDGAAARERYLQRLNASIRSDFWHGYMLPAEAANFRGQSLVDKDGLQPATPDSLRSHEEEEDAANKGEMLEHSLLPLLSDMTLKQKLALARQIEEQSKKLAVMKRQQMRHLAACDTASTRTDSKSSRRSIVLSSPRKTSAQPASPTRKPMVSPRSSSNRMKQEDEVTLPSTASTTASVSRRQISALRPQTADQSNPSLYSTANSLNFSPIEER